MSPDLFVAAGAGAAAVTAAVIMMMLMMMINADNDLSYCVILKCIAKITTNLHQTQTYKSH